MLHLRQKIQIIKKLLALLAERNTIEQKVSFLLEEPSINAFDDGQFLQWINLFPPYEQYLLLCPVALGQGSALYNGRADDPTQLLTILDEIERFYATIGGILGYHLAVLQLLVPSNEEQRQTYLQPLKIDIRQQTDEVHQAIRAGIENLHLLAELYPVGGAGDRLALICPDELEPLPAAQLPFCGITLLEGLFRDLQAREYLHFKLTGMQAITPVALMTSQEKANDARITKILVEKNYFGRPATTVRLFKQPMVPLITEEGEWVIPEPMIPLLKPGGHGAVWRLAISEGVFDWFEKQGRIKGLVRQINNPIAGIDYGLLAFLGIGLKENKAFGFAACPRVVHNAEGTDVLVETQDKDGFAYTLSNIEYTEFERRGIEDRSIEKNGRYSAFPANTNILFFDLQEIRKAVAINPIPGMILNMKNQMEIGGRKLHVGRLESTMQNISDVIIDRFKTKPDTQSLRNMRVYLTYNERRKTLSVAKNAYSPEKSAIGTPEGCFYEWMENMEELLVTWCKMQLPALPDLETYLKKEPAFNVHYHPSLGPQFEVISQKIRGGSMGPGSELILNIAELELQNIQIQGSLIIQADHIMGDTDGQGILHYNNQSGKCTLLNCKVINKGLDHLANQYYWKQELIRKECLDIRLEGNGEFFAENIAFKGSMSVVVPDGYRVVASEQNGKIVMTKSPISKPTWFWKYRFAPNHQILLEIARQTDTPHS